MKDYFSYLLYLTAWRLLRFLPEKFAYKLAHYSAGVLVHRKGKRVERLRSNLARVKPELNERELTELTLAAMGSGMRYWFDTFRFPDWSKDKILKTVTAFHEEYLFDPYNSGKGVIVALPHAGNWDHAGAYFCARGVRLTTVVEHLKPEKLFRKFLDHRQKMGMEAFDLDSRVIAKLAQRLREGNLIALVADRDLSQSGIEVDFFGGKARMPAGPALLAIQTGAPLITAYVSYLPEGIRVEFDSPIAIPLIDSAAGTSAKARSEQIAVMVQECARRFERDIRARPEDWHMLQRIWIDRDFKEREENVR